MANPFGRLGICVATSPPSNSQGLKPSCNWTIDGAAEAAPHKDSRFSNRFTYSDPHSRLIFTPPALAGKN
jgi:hypothetical protein